MHQKDYGTFEFDLARRWAPVHWQQVNEKSWKADLITAVDYAGTWKTIGNWDRMSGHPLVPVVYYSVVESVTHWFVLYFYYHPRDWNALGIGMDQHENDIEGLLTVIEKPQGLAGEAEHGSLVAMITIAHNHFYSYTNALQGNHETVDGDLFFAFSDLDGKPHPCTRQEAEGHGCYGLQPTDSRKWKDLGRPHELNDAASRKAFEFPGGKGVRYVPGDVAVEPTGYGAVTTQDIPYVLVDMFEEGGFWERRCAPVNEPFTAGNRLAGRKFEDDKASPPWAWNDKDDSSRLGEGTIATDPITLVEHYLKGFGRFSHEYVRNPYRQPLDCQDHRLESIRAGREADLDLESAAGARPAGRRAIQRRLRAAIDPAEREDVVIGLMQDADRSPRFRRDMIAAARSMISDALAAKRSRLGPDASQAMHLSIPAIVVVGRFGDRASRPLLVRVLRASSDRDVLLATLDSLRRLSPGNVGGFKAAILPLLSHGDRDVRQRATRLYAEVLARRDPEPLETLIADPSSAVRAAALEGLGRSGRRAYGRLLRQAADDPDEDVSVVVAATEALMQLGAAVPGAEEASGFESARGPTITETPGSTAEYRRFCLERLRQR